MGKLYELTAGQRKAVTRLLQDPRGRLMEMPDDPSTCQKVKIRLLDGQVIGEIELFEAIKIRNKVLKAPAVHRNPFNEVKLQRIKWIVDRLSINGTFTPDTEPYRRLLVGLNKMNHQEVDDLFFMVQTMDQNPHRDQS